MAALGGAVPIFCGNPKVGDALGNGRLIDLSHLPHNVDVMVDFALERMQEFVKEPPKFHCEQLFKHDVLELYTSPPHRTLRDKWSKWLVRLRK